MAAANYGLIMAGGRGTRFWPRSRKRMAKQVLRLFGERSLIQQTVDRLRPLIPPERIWILTNPYLRAEIVRQLPEVPKRQILAEPAQRNTCPCIGLAARILESLDPDAVMGVFPSDHVIARPARYRRMLRPAFRAARDGKLVVLGIQPRWPETGYGYIEFPEGVRAGALEPIPVLQFREKPDLETARQFVAAGRFFWNAGMFFWRASVFLDALRRYLPQTAQLLDELPPFGSRKFHEAVARLYPRCENISVDYAVMEKATNVVGLAADDIGWNDVGSWNAVYELLAHDRDGNAARSEALFVHSSGNYVDAEGKLVALVGVRDLVVVDTPDALLVADRRQAQKVGDVVKLLEQQKRDELL
ncbi:MAG: mannose-1-phosphate guanylyltransferase [Bryobacterales bacterium]|nr:sugar phosphate nucleotidyltransferase [Bryobacteraceae bacterium]MDW8355220.1 mannose-1-phosphate guanylyltransferase [Bryobacterales bacterium]